MKKLMLTMLSVVGMMLFVALPAKACTSYYVGKDCTKDGTTMYRTILQKRIRFIRLFSRKRLGRMRLLKMRLVQQHFRLQLK